MIVSRSETAPGSGEFMTVISFGAPYGSEMERRIMQGGFNCAGEYRLAPAAPASWPADYPVPPRAVQGLRDAPLGADEGELCLRTEGGYKPCLGVIEYLPDASLGACWCPAGHPPCGYCTSTMPECPACGWRLES